LLFAAAEVEAQDYLDRTTYANSSYPITTSNGVVIDTTWSMGYDYFKNNPSHRKAYYRTDGSPTTSNRCNAPVPFEHLNTYWISWSGGVHTYGDVLGQLRPVGNVIAGSTNYDWELRRSEFSYTFS